MQPPGFFPILAVACLVALAAGIALLAIERRRRAGGRDLLAARSALEQLRDEVWHLEAAAAARDRAEAANEAKSRFLATVSHEIRTPLAGIIGTADLLAALPLEGEAASYVGAIRTSGAALGTLIDEILDFSRIEAGRLQLACEPFDVPALVESVVELLSPRAQDKGLAIAGLVEPACPRTLHGDPARLRQILLNLAGNSIKFTKSGGIGLSVAPAGPGTLRFTVGDTGCGVPPERQHAIFEEFEQGDHSATRGHGGAGLGLAISRALAHRMGGALTLDASSPDGSTFSLTLPCPDAAPLRAVAAGTRRRVLLVAGAPFEASFLARRLGALGANVTHCETVDAALEAMCEPPFDLAILDRALGEPAVLRLSDAARGAGVGEVAILLSPFERRAMPGAVWRSFDGWLVKPVRDASLRQLIEQRVPRAPDPSGDAPAAPRLRGRHVLVAEDDDVNALIAIRSLERHGAQVTRVADGAAAVAALDGAAAAEHVDAVLMDIRMPVLDGLSAARQIREGEAHRGARPLPLVALSANAFAEDRSAALDAGFDRFLVKPVGLDALASAVADLLPPPPARVLPPAVTKATGDVATMAS